MSLLIRPSCKKSISTIWLLLMVAFTSLPTPIQSYRVLGLFPHPGVSHFHFFHPIMRELAAAGHNVTVISHFPDAGAPENYKDLPLTGMDTLTNAVNLDVSMRVPIKTCGNIFLTVTLLLFSGFQIATNMSDTFWSFSC